MSENVSQLSAGSLYVLNTEAEDADTAQEIAEALGVPVFNTTQPERWCLKLQSQQLALCRPDNLTVNIDFVNGKAIQRAREPQFAKQPLAKAIGYSQWSKKHTEEQLHVIDATTGLGTDAWMLALLGCRVTMLERSAVLHCLLAHALHQAAQHAATLNTTNNTQLVHTDAKDWLNTQTSTAADVIYLDPMYPEKRKQALVKKGMQLLHDLIGADTNNERLLPTALSKARYRVVVKRPKGAPVLQGSDAHEGQRTSIESPGTRYDVYHL